MPVKITVQSTKFLARLRRLEERMTPKGMDAAVERAGLKTQVALVRATPKRWTGNTRKGWTVERPRHGTRIVINRVKSMLFLERGTANGGTGYIRPRRAKRLFVPLRKEAAAGWKPSLKYGVHYVLKKEVRGIRPRRIIARQRPLAQQRLREEIQLEVRNALNG